MRTILLVFAIFAIIAFCSAEKLRRTTDTTTSAPVEVCSGSKRRNCVPATTTSAPVEVTTPAPTVCDGTKRRNCSPPVEVTTPAPTEVTTPAPTVCIGSKRRNCVPDTTEPPVEVTTPAPTACTGSKRRNCVPVETTAGPVGQDQSGDNNAKEANSSVASVVAGSALIVAAVFAL
jgi:hypothetical protein